MSAIGILSAIASDPEVRAIVLPLAREVAAWVRGGPKPRWLSEVLLDVPELSAPAALADARSRRARAR
jgi:hypothetical protein